jgi:oxygen-independent coproporphyrinogen-3 oxidase
MNYWDNGSYLGLGPSAVSYLNGKREENISCVEDYIDRVNHKECVASSGERLDKISSAKETAAVKIRTMDGIDFNWFKKKTGLDFLELEKESLPRLFEDGLVEYIEDAGARKGLRLTHRGIMLCDIVSSGLL